MAAMRMHRCTISGCGKVGSFYAKKNRWENWFILYDITHSFQLRSHVYNILKNYVLFTLFQEFKLKVHLARHLATTHGLAIRAGSPRPVMKTRAAFCLITTPLTRISRQVCADIMKVRHAARQPFIPINIAAIKQECKYRYHTLTYLLCRYKQIVINKISLGYIIISIYIYLTHWS